MDNCNCKSTEVWTQLVGAMVASQEGDEIMFRLMSSFDTASGSEGVTSATADERVPAPDEIAELASANSCTFSG